MKNIFITLMIMCLISLGTEYKVLSQTTHTLTLKVNTADIKKRDAYLYCTFSGQPENTDTREFKTVVDVGDKIIWLGVSTSSENDIVQIKSINHEGGDNVFDKNVLKDSNENPGIVEGIVQQGTEGFVQKYKISFKIIRNGDPDNTNYNVDPKIEVRKYN
ncbi:hypothetical protein [Marinigracilibium pacificum]|uniref:Uncharacterized protein n=1 Tax=Marinigracilibium pacificum TaxID=2729599 RepID=A0A848IX96_9BACT|nr:hypothetical protein [Marinigracilibium pacificum]NMM47905.1 hypothetical protein [Marinigracilibium pacificum]